MPKCRGCQQEVDELVSVSVTAAGSSKKLCEDCAQEAAEAEELSLAAEAAMRGVMEYKGNQ